MNTFTQNMWLKSSQEIFSGTLVQKALANLMKESTETSDIEAYKSLLRTVIERVGQTSIIPMITSVIPATTSQGKVPVMSNIAVGAKDTVKTGTIQVFTVDDASGFVVDDIIVSSDAKGTVLYSETNKLLVDVTEGTFATSDQVGELTSVVAEAVGTGTGVLNVFTLDNAPVYPLSDAVYVDAVLKTRDVDYTIDNATGTITFTVAPALNAVITADYDYITYSATISLIHTNVIGVGTMFSNYTGPYSTSVAEGLTGATAKEIQIKVTLAEFTAEERKAFTGLTLEFIQDLQALYGKDATQKIIEVITNLIEQEIEQEFFVYLKTIATQKADLPLSLSYGTQSALGTGGVFEDILASIMKSIGAIGTDTGLSGEFFVVASSKVVSALRHITKVYKKPEYSALNSKYVGHLLNSDIMLIEDPYSYTDYFTVGCSGPKGADNSGTIFVPYTVDFINVVDPATFETKIAVMNRYDMIRSPLDTKTGNGSSDFYHMQVVDFSNLTNYNLI